MLQKELTYIGVRNRIKKICTNHKLIKQFVFGKYVDYLASNNVNYPCVFLQSNGGTIAPGRHDSSVSFRLFVLDRTFLSMDSEENEADVMSDCIGIARDLVAFLNWPGYDDWAFSPTSNFELLADYNSDITAGLYFDFDIRIKYYQNVCAVPTNVIINPDDDMKEVYDIKWTAPLDILDGTFSFPVPGDVVGKKVLLVVRANYSLFRTELSTVESNEFKYDGTIITYGTPIVPGETTLILYRVY